MLKEITMLDRGTYIGTLNNIMLYSLTYKVKMDIWGIVNTPTSKFPYILPDQEFDIYYLEADQIVNNKIVDRKYFLISSRYKLILEAFEWLKYYSKRQPLGIHRIGTALRERKTSNGSPTPFPCYSDFEGTIKTRLLRKAKEARLINNIGVCAVGETCFTDDEHPSRFIDTIIKEMAAAREELSDLLAPGETM